MPAQHPDDIIRPGEDETVFNLIFEYYNISRISQAPKNSINTSIIKFYKKDENPGNDYLIINFNKNQFHSWHKLSWITRVLNFFNLRSFKFKRSDYNFLWGTYIQANNNEEPIELHCIYCMGTIKPFVLFFFELFDGSGTEGNSVGVKIPKGAA